MRENKKLWMGAGCVLILIIILTCIFLFRKDTEKKEVASNVESTQETIMESAKEDTKESEEESLRTA